MDLLEKLEKKEKSRRGFSAANFINSRLYTVILFLALSMAVLAAGIMYVKSCRLIYCRESSVYWDICRGLTEKIKNGGFWSAVYESIGTAEDNYIAAVPIALWMRIFGPMRAAYTSGIIMMYVVPSYLLIYHLSVKLSKAPRFSFAAAALIMPVTMYLAFNGYADVGGVMIALACYDLYYTRSGTTGAWYRYVMIGALLAVIMLFRDYYAYFAVSFFAAMIIDSIIHRRNGINMAVTAAAALLLLVLFFREFIAQVLLNNYTNTMFDSAVSVWGSFAAITRYFGLLFIVLALAASVAVGAVRHEYKTLFAWIQCVLCAVTFMMSVAPEEQHMLLYVPALTVITIYSVNCISRQWMLMVVCAVTVINLVCVNTNSIDRAKTVKGAALLPAFSMRARTQENIEDVIELRNTLDAAIPEGASCTVLASSDALNDAMLKNANISTGTIDKRPPEYISSVTVPDEYGALSLDKLYYSDFILVAFPAQTIPGSDSEKAISEAVGSFENGTDIAQFFEQVQWFSWRIGDVSLSLYERVKEPDIIRKHEFEMRFGR